MHGHCEVTLTRSPRRSSTARRPRACAKNCSPVHDREKSGPRGLLLVPVHPRAVSGAADDNGERGNVKPDVRRGARQAYWVSGLFQWGLAFEHLIDRSRRPRARAAQPSAPADRPARRLRETGRTGRGDGEARRLYRLPRRRVDHAMGLCAARRIGGGR